MPEGTWEEGNMSKNEVSVSKLMKRLDLKEYTDGLDLKRRKIQTVEINRPGLQLAGYFQHFNSSRVQVIGNVEYFYIKQLDDEKRLEIYRELLGYDIPCIIFSRNHVPDGDFIRIAEENGIPVLGTEKSTSRFSAELIRELSELLAPCITIHGVLVDVYGEGVLITGESGIGKSEAALELVRRGHRLVSDDVVEIRKIDEHTLVGTAPNVTRNFIELRGIGIVDVKTLYGVECIKEKQVIDLVVRLQEWKKDAEFDRMGLEEEYIEYLDNQVVCHSVPIRPGRNIAVICETAAVNHRQKKMGYNAAKELYRRVQENLVKARNQEDEY